MRHLIVADLHYSLRQWDWVVGNAGRFDGVIIAGDLLDITSSVDREAQIIVILKYLARIARATPRLLVTSGNHDLDDADATGQRAAGWLDLAKASGVLIDGDSCLSGDCLISLCRWWESDADQAAIEAQLARDASRPHHVWIWIHHAPPLGSRTSWNGHKDAGDAALTDWIRKFRPNVVLSGHIHQAPFKEGGSWVDRIEDTWVFNAGYYIAAQPPFLVLDLEKRQVEWISAAGHEHVDLDQPPSPANRGPASPAAEAGSPAPRPPSRDDPRGPRTAA